MSTSNDVLDAARTCLLRSAGRKITLAEVAREAGVSRPTVYRRWPEVSAVVRDLVTRDMARLVTEHIVAVDTALAADDAADRALDALVDAITGVAIGLSADALFESLLRRQPDVMAPYVFRRLGSSQRGVLDFLTPRIVAAQDLGAVRPGRAEQLAAMVLLISQSSIQSRSVMEPLLGADWSTELALAVRGYLSVPATASLALDSSASTSTGGRS